MHVCLCAQMVGSAYIVFPLVKLALLNAPCRQTRTQRYYVLFSLLHMQCCDFGVQGVSHTTQAPVCQPKQTLTTADM